VTEDSKAKKKDLIFIKERPFHEQFFQIFCRYLREAILGGNYLIQLVNLYFWRLEWL